jgi:hypothetical protein
MGLGSLNGVTLAEARDKAKEYRRLLADGKDPIEARDAEQTQARLKSSDTISFAECAKKYIAAHRSGWRNPKHIEQWETPWRPTRTLEPIWSEKPETASRVRGRIEHVLDWAKVRGYRSGDNPARWCGHLAKLLPNRSKVQRVTNLAALPYTGSARKNVSSRASSFAIIAEPNRRAILSLLLSSERSVGEIERELRLRSDSGFPSAADTLRSVLS